MSLYDYIYEVENYFGEPYPELICFFNHLPEKGNVLDIDYRQGRDAISLAKLRFNIIGVDE